MESRSVYARLGAGLVALGVGGAAIVVAVLLLRSEPGPVAGAPATAPAAVGPALPAPSLGGGRIATPNQPGFPSPPPGALVLAREAGSDAIALAVVPGRPRSLVRVSVVGPAGPGVSGLDVSVALGAAAPVRLAHCGQGCYQAAIALATPARATVVLHGRSYPFSLPSRPWRNGSAVMARATGVWKSLRTLVWHERLAGSPTEVISTVYEAVAPDELSYTIRGASSAIIIGERRWDRPSPGSPWVQSVQNPPVQVPTPFWSQVEDAHILGTGRDRGHPVESVTFFDPATPAWFQAEVDSRTGRTVELWMIAASHFMHHLYGPFDAKLHVQPPPAS